MGKDYDEIDVERLKEKMIQDSKAAFYAGGHGGAFFEAMDIKKASHEEVLEIAKRKGMI